MPIEQKVKEWQEMKLRSRAGSDRRELCRVKELEFYRIGTEELLSFKQGYKTVGLNFK